MIHTEDVSDRVRAESALRHSELRYRTLAEASPVGLYHTDAAGRCVYVNEQWCRVTGLTPAEAAGDGWAAALHPDDRDRVFAEWHAAAAAGGTFHSEYRFQRPDGTSSWVIGQGLAERDDAGRVVGFVGTVTDITARKRAERALEELNEQLERRVAERTEALLARTRELESAEALLRDREQHLRHVADHNARLAQELEHRVGNHLAGLLTLVAEMRERGAAAHDLARAMEGRLIALARVNRLLAAAGWRPVGWQSILTPLLAGLGSAAPHACETTVSGPDAPVDAKQATALAMILSEWFTNSCKYGAHSVAGGRLAVRVEELPDAASASSSAAAAAPGQRWLRLTWSEAGGPEIAGPVTASLGTELVQGFASRELRGRCVLSFHPSGAAHALEFPVNGHPRP
jgi:PAS domain S-box-containing protein